MLVFKFLHSIGDRFYNIPLLVKLDLGLLMIYINFVTLKSLQAFGMNIISYILRMLYCCEIIERRKEIGVLKLDCILT